MLYKGFKKSPIVSNYLVSFKLRKWKIKTSSHIPSRYWNVCSETRLEIGRKKYLIVFVKDDFRLNIYFFLL